MPTSVSQCTDYRLPLGTSQASSSTATPFSSQDDHTNHGPQDARQDSTGVDGRIGAQQPPWPITVIADDLTGAMDSGLQFATRGLSTIVAMSAEPTWDVQVVVHTTESRELPTSEAVKRMETLAPLVAGELVYKKIDSTLRGNWGYELRCLDTIRMPRAIVMAPAFPQQRRTTVQGIQYVDGRPLALSEFRHDPRWPMRESSVLTLVLQQAGIEPALVSHPVVDQGPAAIAQAIQACAARVIVVDAVSDDDLAHIAQALWELGPDWIPCGSAGLARAWAGQIAPQKATGKIERLPVKKPTLFVCGSRNPTTLRQLERLLASGLAHCTLDPRGSYDQALETGRLAGLVCASLESGRDTVLEACTATMLPGNGRRVARILGDVVHAAAEAELFGALFLTGGETAVTVCQQIGVVALRIVQAIQPGLPGGLLIGGPCDGMPAATKAGGFGTAEALLDVAAWLRTTQGIPCPQK